MLLCVQLVIINADHFFKLNSLRPRTTIIMSDLKRLIFVYLDILVFSREIPELTFVYFLQKYANCVKISANVSVDVWFISQWSNIVYETSNMVLRYGHWIQINTTDVAVWIGKLNLLSKHFLRRASFCSLSALWWYYTQPEVNLMWAKCRYFDV